MFYDLLKILYFLLINLENIFKKSILKIINRMRRNTVITILYILFETKSYQMPKSPNKLYFP